MKNLRLVVEILIIVAGLVFVAARIRIFPLFDYIQYWAAVQLNLQQGDPYAPDQMLAMEQTQGWPDPEAIMMWNPPQTIGYMLPFGIFPYNFSRTLYFFFTLLAAMGSAALFWQIYGGPPGLRWLPAALALSFGPMLQLFKLGQVDAWILVGIAGFLYFQRQKRPFWAGALTSLTLVKPHIVYLVWLALGLWAIKTRAWKFVAGAAAGLALPLAVSWLVNPGLVGMYLARIGSQAPDQWVTATIGSQLRLLFGADIFWLQFLPSLVGAVVFLVVYFRRSGPWDWESQLPLLVVASLATAAYGWVFDLCIAILAVVALAASLVRRYASLKEIPPLTMALLAGFAALSLFLGFTNLEQHELWWGGSVLLLLYWAFQRTARLEPAPT